MTANTTKTTTPHNLNAMSLDELNNLAAIVSDLIASRQAPALTNDHEPNPAPAKGRKSNKRNSGEWEEIKTINGHQYRYRRYWQDGRLRSKYIGKA
jgi:hypothetical protein